MFNIGDRVYVLSGFDYSGKIGRIVDIDEDYPYPYDIHFDGEEKPCDDLFSAEMIRHVAQVPMNPTIENNFKYHSPQQGQAEKYEILRQCAKELAYVIDSLCPDSREKSLAMTKLEETVMWANSSIARNGNAKHE